MAFLEFFVLASGCKDIGCSMCMLLCFQACSKCRAYADIPARELPPYY